MNFIEGQAVFGKIQFVDGEFPEYDRPYLIVNVKSDSIEVLNVSSINGKERKLAFPTNERLKIFNPPFIKPSFVKLDSLREVKIKECANLRLLCSGKTLDAAELERIKKLLQR